jgi:hypothetical protein
LRTFLHERFPDSQPDFTDDIFVSNPISGEADVRVYVGNSTGHSGAPSSKNTVGELAPIVTSTMDLSVIRTWADDQLCELLDMCLSLAAWKPYLLLDPYELPSCMRRGTSRRMLKHMSRLVEWSVVRQIPLSDILCVTNYFTVDKKDGSLRLVVDGRKVNAIMRRPPKMPLPEIHTVVDYIMSHKLAMTVDGKSYFYQVPISEEVGRMFCANLADARGPFATVAMQRLPMGWSYAPLIAQKISNTLLTGKDGRRLGYAWIDNFIFAGDSEEEIQANFAEFLTRCREAHVLIDNENPVASTSLVALGVKFDLAAGTYDLDPKWVEKRLVLRAAASMSPRQLYTLTGSMIWHDYVKRIPLCHQEGPLEVIRRVASAISKPSDWDTPQTFTDTEVRCINQWLDSLLSSGPKRWLPRTDRIDAKYYGLTVLFVRFSVFRIFYTSFLNPF